MYQIRGARPPDLPALERLLAPARARGELRPRALSADAVIVAEDHDGKLIGAVALANWSASVVELCSLYSDRPGLGLGTALTQAAVERARTRGCTLIVALTHRPDFFSRRGFVAAADRPWARARGMESIAEPEHAELPGAVATKACTSCARCPALETCHQELFVQRLAPAARRACA